MSNLLQLSPQALSLLFTHVAEKESVFWIRSYQPYYKLLYISPNYKRVWGLSCQALYENPTFWSGALIQKDKQENVIHYTIKQKHNKSVLIEDKYFHLSDVHGNTLALAGIATPVPENLVENQIANYLNDTQKPLIEQITQVLTQNLALIQSDLIKQKQKEYRLNIDNNIVKFTPREAQCLYYFLKGKSSKKIAQILDISFRTVEIYFDRIRKKTGCQTRIEIISKIKDRYLIEQWTFKF